MNILGKVYCETKRQWDSEFDKINRFKIAKKNVIEMFCIWKNKTRIPKLTKPTMWATSRGIRQSGLADESVNTAATDSISSPSLDSTPTWRKDSFTQNYFRTSDTLGTGRTCAACFPPLLCTRLCWRGCQGRSLSSAAEREGSKRRGGKRQEGPFSP